MIADVELAVELGQFAKRLAVLDYGIASLLSVPTHIVSRLFWSLSKM
jgi:hypothetical protein